MSWFDCAIKKELLPESNSQPAIRPTQVIFHSMAAPWTTQRLYEYWASAESNGLESHFGVSYDGSIMQYIGTETRADANYYANLRNDGTGAISVETASTLKSDDKWTPEQVEALIKIGAEAHVKHSIPLTLCRSWDGAGYGIHSMYSQWSKGPTACPGALRAVQFRQEVLPGIIARATAIKNPTMDVLAEIAAIKKRLDALEAKAQ